MTARTDWYRPPRFGLGSLLGTSETIRERHNNCLALLTEAGENTVLAPCDRSFAVRLDPAALDGFLVFCHAGKVWRVCHDHLRRPGTPAWQPTPDRW
jgi:hypothetical protein